MVALGPATPVPASEPSISSLPKYPREPGRDLTRPGQHSDQTPQPTQASCPEVCTCRDGRSRFVETLIPLLHVTQRRLRQRHRSPPHQDNNHTRDPPKQNDGRCRAAPVWRAARSRRQRNWVRGSPHNEAERSRRLSSKHYADPASQSPPLDVPGGLPDEPLHRSLNLRQSFLYVGLDCNTETNIPAI